MLKRIGLFLFMNILVMITIQIVIFILQSFFDVDVYQMAGGNGYIIILSLVWGMGGSFISLRMSKYMAKKFMGVQVVDGSTQYSHLVNLVHKYAKMANLPKMPEVGVYDSPEVNAFATGPSKSNSLVAVSTGLLQRMDEDEIEGVLAHEIGHIANGDMLTMALIQGVINAFVIFISRALAQVLLSDDEEGVGSSGFTYFFVVIGLEIAFGFLGAILVAYFSRAREFRADSEGARLAGREKMIKALQRLQNQFENGPIDKRGEALQAFKISNHGTGLMRFISTHPSLESRIQALQYRV